MTKTTKTTDMILTDEEKVLLVNLICDKQNVMIMRFPDKFPMPEYTRLEELKVKIKSM